MGLSAIAAATLLAACGGGGDGDGGGGTVPPPANVTVSGRITYERVNFSADPTQGLDYANTTALPAREIVVELLRPDQTVLSTTATDSNGNYSFTTSSNTDVIVRARAHTRRVAPGWDIRVLNNTNGNALYVLDSATFNTGSANVTHNLLADSGWPETGGTRYTGTRAAAPFAILDTLYTAIQLIRSSLDAPQDLPALAAHWSPENKASEDFDPSTGAIRTTSYVSGNIASPGIYVLGLDGVDTDEYDAHVIAHEYYHFVEGALSRSDSVGGSHTLLDLLDLRVAFSEGMGNAFSAMVTGSSLYSDSGFSAQGTRFGFDVETDNFGTAGWFSENSVQSVVWDLFDTAQDALPQTGSDTVALGFGPILDVLVNEVRTGAALTSIFPLIVGLRQQAGASVAGINALVANQEFEANDEFGTGEGNDGGVPSALPVYKSLTLNQPQATVCGTTAVGEFNKLGNRIYFRFTLAASQPVSIRATYTANGSAAPFTPTPDPDLVLYRSGFFDIGDSGDANIEQLDGTLAAGTYVLELYEFSHVDPAPTAGRRGVTCFNVSFTG